MHTSEAVRYLFNELGDKLSVAFDAIIRAIRDLDERAAHEVLTMKADINHLLQSALEIQSSALAKGGSDQIELIRMEMTAFDCLKRIHTHLKRIAKEIVPPELGN